MASATFSVLGGQVVDPNQLILEELQRANASAETLAQNQPFTSDVHALAVSNPPLGQAQPATAPMSAFVKQYISDIGGIPHWGPGYTTIAGRVDNRYSTRWGALTAEQAISIIGLAGYVSTPTGPLPGSPPANTMGLPPPLGGTPLIYNTNMPAFVGGDLGTIILTKAAEQDAGGTLQPIILGTTDQSLPQVRMTGDWAEDQEEGF